MKPQPKKPNGNKIQSVATCPHAPDCAAPTMHAELMASIDQLGTSVGMLLESHEGLALRISQVHDEFLGHAKSATDCNEYIVTALRRLGGEDA
jgi:hypothetical protein